VVQKIWSFKVSGGYFMIFLRLGTPLKLFSKFQGPFVKTMDYGLITKKLRGFFAKMPGNIGFWLF
jgi:hypothetical protein